MYRATFATGPSGVPDWDYWADGESLRHVYDQVTDLLDKKGGRLYVST